MPRPKDHPKELWYAHPYSGEVHGIYKNATVRVLMVEGPLTEPIRPPFPEAHPGAMQTIPLDQDKATFLIELQWPDSSRKVVPFRELSFPD